MKKVILFIGVLAILMFSGCDEKVPVVLTEDDSAQVVVNGSVTIDVLANDIADESLDKSIKSVTNGTHGDTEITESQTIIYTSKDGYVGGDIFKYILEAGDMTNEGTVIINIVEDEEVNEVVSENLAPHVSAGNDRSMELSQTITIIGQDSDSDGNIVDRKWSNSTEILARERIFSFTPTSLGTKVLFYTVKDDDGASANDSMNVLVLEPSAENHAPVADAENVTLSSCDIGNVMTIQLHGTDADGDSLIYSIDVSGLNYGTAVLIDEDTGMATFTIDDAEANSACRNRISNSFTFKVNDGVVDSNSATVNFQYPVIVPIPVNHAPVAEDQDVEISNCEIGQSTDIQLVASDSDGDDLLYSIVTTPAYGTVVLTDVNTGMATFTIDDSVANDACIDRMPNSFTFKVNDSVVDSNSATVTLLRSESVSCETDSDCAQGQVCSVDGLCIAELY